MNNRNIRIDTVNIIIPSSEDTDTDTEDMDKAVALLESARERIELHLNEDEECHLCDEWLDDIDTFIESVTND